MKKFAVGFNRVLCTLFVAVLLLSSVSLTVSAKVGQMYVSRVGGLRAHEKALGASPVIFKLSKGEKVEHLATANGWWQIKTASGQVGYVYRTYLKSVGNPIKKNAFYKVYKTSNLTVRKAPRSIADKLGTIKRGTSLQLKAKRGNWGFVKLKNNRSGWVQLKYLSYLRG